MTSTATVQRITVGCDTPEEASYIAAAIEAAQQRYRTEQMDALHAEANRENWRRTEIQRSHRTVIKKAFSAMRREGIVVKVSIDSCCPGCAEQPESMKGKANVWTLRNRWAACFTGERLTHTLYLHWGHDGDVSHEQVLDVARTAIAVLERFGLTTEWDGTTSQTICVKPEPVKVEAYDAALAQGATR